MNAAGCARRQHLSAESSKSFTIEGDGPIMMFIFDTFHFTGMYESQRSSTGEYGVFMITLRYSLDRASISFSHDKALGSTVTSEHQMSFQSTFPASIKHGIKT